MMMGGSEALKGRCQLMDANLWDRERCPTVRVAGLGGALLWALNGKVSVFLPSNVSS